MKEEEKMNTLEITRKEFANIKKLFLDFDPGKKCCRVEVILLPEVNPVEVVESWKEMLKKAFNLESKNIEIILRKDCCNEENKEGSCCCK